LIKGKTVKLKKGDWLPEGSKVKTAARSFAKLLFIDKSQMNVAPKSQVEIKAFPKDKAGIINLIKGKVRSKVTKNYMNMDKSKSKLFIKTKSAAMGVRGTDFQVIFNPKNDVTSLVTFEGRVAMVKIDRDLPKIKINQDILESRLNSSESVMVKQGQYSGVNPTSTRATVPVKISPSQLETMKNSEEGSGKKTDSSMKGKGQSSNIGAGAKSEKRSAVGVRSIIPPGVSAKAFSSEAKIEKVIEKSVGGAEAKEIVTVAKQQIEIVKEDAPPPEGFLDKSTGVYAPPAGGYIDQNTGLYIPPPPGSSFDANAGVYVPPPTMGGFDQETGEYMAPEGLKLNDDGTFIVDAPPPPLPGEEGRTPASTSSGDTSDGVAPPPTINVTGPIVLEGGTSDPYLDPNSEPPNVDNFVLEDDPTEEFNNPPPTNDRTRVRIGVTVE
jgi:hypothetical protein